MKKYLAISGLAVIVIGIVAFVVVSSNSATKPTAVIKHKSYVALGDSVAAGVGLQGDSDSSACDRTNQSYPKLLAKSQGYKLQNIACGGATLGSGILGDQEVNKAMVTPQLQQLFGSSRPDVVTITIGANDADWTTILSKCYTSQCGTSDDVANVNNRLSAVRSNIQAMLNQIKTYYGGNPPHVLLTGYYQVFPNNDQSCSDFTGITAEERSFGRQLQTDISQTITSASAGYDFAAYVPLDFSGHELCSTNPWVQGIADTKPYHPTATGQATIARQLATKIKGLGL